VVYDAFISYSHTADGKIAPALQRALKHLAKPWYRLRSLNVFRDETDLSAASDLTAAISAALSNSRYFVYLASPEAASSRWVGAEIEVWKKRNLPENLLIAVTEGEIEWDTDRKDFDWEKSTALHPNLKDIFSKEPLWVDLRWAKADQNLSPRDPRFQHATAMLAAPMHGKTLEDLVGEDVHQHRKTQILIGIVVTALTLLLTLSILATTFSTKANQNLRSKLTLIESIMPFFNVEDSNPNLNLEQTGLEEADEKTPFFRRLWFSIKANFVTSAEIEKWIEWGPDRAALAEDCSSYYSGEEKLKEFDSDSYCPRLKSDFDKDGLRKDIDGLAAMARALVRSLNNGRLEKTLNNQWMEEEKAAGREILPDLIEALLRILLSDPLWKQITKATKENKQTQEFSSKRYLNIWRGPLHGAGGDAELILMRLVDTGLCGSGGCFDLMLGFLRVGEKYELTIANVEPGEVAVYYAGRGNMPQIFTISVQQAGFDDQYRQIHRYKFDGNCVCYIPYLEGSVRSSRGFVDQRVPQQLNPVKR
jgi:hypothetical protein